MTPVEQTETQATYSGLLATREFRSLWIAHVASMLGDVIAGVALAVLVFERTESPLLSALTFSLVFVPHVVVGVFLSSLVDRLPVRSTLVACHLASAVLVAVMALPGMPIWALFVLLTGLGLIAPIFSSVRASILPDVLPDPVEYVLGRAMLRMVAQSAQVAGSAVGGALLLVLRPRGALVVDAGSFALSAVFVYAGTNVRPRRTPSSGTSVLRDSLLGLRSVLSHQPLRPLLLFAWLLPVCAVAPEALVVPYAKLIGEPVSSVGILLGAMPAGSVLADLVGGRLLRPRWQSRVAFPAALSTCLSLLAFVLRPVLPFALLLLFATGLGCAYQLALDRMILERTPAELRSRVLAIQGPLLMFTQGAGFALWGLAGEMLSPPTVIVVAGCCGLLILGWLRPYAARVAS